VRVTKLVCIDDTGIIHMAMLKKFENNRWIIGYSRTKDSIYNNK
jgi:hypothetical protein